MVKKGETLWKISQAYNCDPAKLAEANNLPDNHIEAGSIIFIPDAASTISIKPGTTSSHKADDTTKKGSPKIVKKTGRLPPEMYHRRVHPNPTGPVLYGRQRVRYSQSSAYTKECDIMESR